MTNPQQNFFKDTINKIPKIHEAIRVLKQEPNNKTCLNILYMFFHTIYATGFTIGVHEVLEVAKSMEDRLSELIDSRDSVEIDFLYEIKDTVNNIKEKINFLISMDEIELPEEPEHQYTQEIPQKVVLIINEDITITNNITDELAKRNFEVIGVGNIEEAKKALERRQLDLIILDAKINSINGMGLLKELHADPRFKWTSKFILIADASYSDIIETLKAGADDYITKPFNMDELITRIEIRIMRMEELHGISVRDPLTGVFTRDYFSERLAEERERLSRQEKPFSVVMCDLDFFKSVNDEHGHQVGDFVLQSFASFLYKQLRRSDTVGRYGGEEFIVLLPETDALTAYKVLERLRSAWEEKKLFVEPDKNKSIEITFSAGISEFDKDGNTEAEIIKAADDALYQAKENGRNKVVRASHSGEGDFPLLPKILVVDDSSLIRSMLLNELKKDFTIFLAKDGQDALLQLQRVKPHVVLADIIMPIMDGLELTKRIREDPYNKNVKIIAMTSDAKKMTVLEAFQAGVDDFVSKPFDNQELEARILRLLRKRSKR